MPPPEPQHSPTESEFWEWGPAICGLTGSPDDSDVWILKFGGHRWRRHNGYRSPDNSNMNEVWEATPLIKLYCKDGVPGQLTVDQSVCLLSKPAVYPLPPTPCWSSQHEHGRWIASERSLEQGFKAPDDFSMEQEWVTEKMKECDHELMLKTNTWSCKRVYWNEWLFFPFFIFFYLIEQDNGCLWSTRPPEELICSIRLHYLSHLQLNVDTSLAMGVS